MSIAPRQPLAIALLVAGAFFMENLDGTVIATALPQMAESFRASPVSLNIGMTAYMLTLAVFIPMSGWVADRFGARTVFGSAIGIFTASSVLCGLSNGLLEFTAARIIQGIGGAMMVPVGRLVVLRSTEKQHLLRSISYIVWPGLVAPVLGPPVGGFITTYASWRWIFFLNVPLGLLGVALTAMLISNEQTRHFRPFDWLGFLYCGTACTALMYGLELVGERPTPWPEISFFLLLSIVMSLLLVSHSSTHLSPLIDFSPMQIRTFAVTMWGGSLFRISISVMGAIALRVAAILCGAHPADLTVMDFHIAFALVGVLALLSVFDFLGLDAAAGAIVSGHEKA